MSALERFGISSSAQKISSSIDKDPTFYTTSSSGDKSQGQICSGIRQGCPLSPYFFIMVLTVLFEDVDVVWLQKGVATHTCSIGRPTDDLEYADDTLLISVTIPQKEKHPSYAGGTSRTLRAAPESVKDRNPSRSA